MWYHRRVLVLGDSVLVPDLTPDQLTVLKVALRLVCVCHRQDFPLVTVRLCLFGFDRVLSLSYNVLNVIFVSQFLKQNRARRIFPHLVQDEPVEVRHVALVGQGPFIVVFEMLLEGHGVMGDLHHCAQVVGQHLRGDAP